MCITDILLINCHTVNREKDVKVGTIRNITYAACTSKRNTICCWTRLHNRNYPEDSTKQEIHGVTLSNTGLMLRD